jgi:Helix-turn-helix domain
MPVHLMAEPRQLALRLKAGGLSLREIGPQVGCSHQGVALIARRSPQRPVGQDRWVPGAGRLTLADREEITLGVHAGESFTVIASRLGKATSTVSREVVANGGRVQYGAWRAHQRAREQAGCQQRGRHAPPPSQPEAGHRGHHRGQQDGAEHVEVPRVDGVRIGGLGFDRDPDPEQHDPGDRADRRPTPAEWFQQPSPEAT